MATVAEIEKQLIDAKNLEKTQELEATLKYMRDNYEGKCFGTSVFERKNRSGFSSAVFYERFWIENSKITVLKWIFSISKMGRDYKFSSKKLSFDRSKSEDSTEHVNQHDVVSSLIGHYVSFKKEVRLERFMNFWETSEAVCTMLDDCYKTEITIEDDYLTIGSNNNEQMLQSGFESIGIDYIDITKYPSLFNALQYKQLPLLQEQKYLPRVYAKQILEYQIELYREEEKKSHYSQKGIRLKYISAIQDFIKSENL